MSVVTKNWVFTVNNPKEEDTPKVSESIQYATWQLEKGANGTEHLQGYVVFTKPCRLKAAKAFMGPRAHLEPRRGTHEEAKAYCSKSDTRVSGPWTIGQEPAQGKRSDLDEIKERLDKGANEKEIADDYFGQWVRYRKSFTAYRVLRDKGARRALPTIVVYWGPSGTGKSLRAVNENPGAYVLRKSNSGSVWFDGYDGEKTIIVDEFYGWLPYDFILRLLDWTPLLVDTKGGAVPIVAEKFVFTSNASPDEWYSGVPDTSAFRRRLREFGQVYEVGQVHRPVPVVPGVPSDPSVAYAKGLKLWKGPIQQ